MPLVPAEKLFSLTMNNNMLRIFGHKNVRSQTGSVYNTMRIIIFIYMPRIGQLQYFKQLEI